MMDMVQLQSKNELIQYIADGCKSEEDFRIGTEHEKFLFNKDTLKRLSYDSKPGIKDILNALKTDYFTPMTEGEKVIGLKGQNGDSITLEPGGQFELSGAPLKHLHQTCRETNEHLQAVHSVCEKLNAIAVGLGYDPISTVNDIVWMPKGRYGLMKDYMPSVGTMGRQMMTSTCTVQVNLDFSSEIDMAKKMRIGAVLQPLITALFANSGIKEKQKIDYQSYRSFTWTDTDNSRCGIPEFILSGEMTFEHWVDYMLDVPMYFVYRDGTYHNALGKSFRDFMNGTLEGFEGQLPTIKDWEDHLTTCFPEVRLKQFIEMRGADAGLWNNLCALPALWVGLLYNNDVMTAVYDLISDFTNEDVLKMRDDVPIQGLATLTPKGSMLDLAKIILPLAKQGLKNRARIGANGEDESKFLYALEEIVNTGLTGTDRMQKILMESNGDIKSVINASIY